MLYNLFENRDFVSVFAVALLAEGVDRNNYATYSQSLARVALLAEGVDRNLIRLLCMANSAVALLAEGVDRNHQKLAPFVPAEVALLAEGVDRNNTSQGMLNLTTASPSSRRAWIEICPQGEPHRGGSRRPPRGGRG